MANKIITFTLALMLILLAYVLYNTLEVYEESVDMGWTLKAKKNPYLATEMMLVKLGSPTESSDTKAILDSLDTYDSVLITNSGLVVNRPMANKILQWVQSGGQLVIGANENRGKLLEILGVEYKTVNYNYEKDEPVLLGDHGWAGGNINSPFQESTDHDNEEENNTSCKKCDDAKDKKACEDCEKSKTSKDIEHKKKISDILKDANKKNHEASTSTENKKDVPAVEVIPERRITYLQFNDDEPAIKAVFSPWSVITHPAISQDDEDDNGSTTKKKTSANDSAFQPVFWGMSAQGIHLIQFSEGKGKITVVSDTSIWDSHQLSRQDHGVLLRTLGFHQKSLILYGIAMPSITTLAWTHFSESIIALLLMLVLCLWRVAIRVGPVQFINSIDRRSIIDSILGLASYQHRRKKYGSLLEPLIADIQATAKRQIPGFATADSAKREKLLSDHTGMSQKNINQLLNPHIVKDDQSFQTTVTLLREIRKTL